MKSKRELLDAIQAKECVMRTYKRASDASEDIDEVRAIGEEMDKLLNEIDDLKNQLYALEINEIDNDESRGFNPNKTITGNNYSYSFNNNLSMTTGTTGNNAALKRGESMASRCKIKAGQNLDLGKYIKGLATGDWNGANEERAAMTTSALGAVIPAFLSAQIIDAARNVSLFTSAGVPVYPMEGNNLTIARVAKDPKFTFKQEGTEGGESTFDLDSVVLNAKTAYGYAYISLEALHSAKNLTDICLQVFAQSMADCIDKGLLYGQNSNDYAPAGVMNDSAINAITATNKGYDDFIRAIGAVKKANGNPSVMGINAKTEEILSLLTDSNGVYLQEPQSVTGLTKVVSNQLASDDSEGNDALVFDPNAIAIGMQNNIVIRMITDSDYCIKNGMVGFQIYAMLDGKAVRPKHIAKVTGIKEVQKA